MTSAPAVDERLHRDAIKLLLPDAFDFGTVPGLDGNPGTTPDMHQLISITRRQAEVRRGGRSGRSGWRLEVVHVGRTPDEARHGRNAATIALEERRLTIGGEISTPVQFESDDPIERDKDGWFSARSYWTYAL